MIENLSVLKEERRKNKKEADARYLEEHFERRLEQYSVVLVDAPELKRFFSQIRHQVFCEEHPEFAIKHDAHSLHFLCFYEPLHMIVGGTRVILPRKDLPWFGLPSVETDGSFFQQEFPHDLSKYCEISRFMLVKERMKIVRNHQNLKGNALIYPDVFRHLVRATVSTCMAYGLDGFIATLEESLFRRSEYFFGMSLTKIGEPFEYHGKRQGGYVFVEDGMKQAKELDPRNYNFLLDGPAVIFSKDAADGK